MHLASSLGVALRRSSLSLLALAFVAFLVAAAPSTAAALPPYFQGDENAFYTLPTASQIPAGGPGTVVRWQRYETSVILTGNADPVVAYRMLYKSTDALGNPNIVSGSVIMPVRLSFNSGSRPIVGFATGTQGMANRCAAVHGIANTTNYDLAYMRPALDKGWALAVADYQGLGLNTPGDEHVQLVGRALGRNVLDSVRTVAQFASEFDSYRQAHWPLKFAIWANISASSKTVLWGYSEGGGAAAWAAQLKPSYAPEINLVGVAAGGVPADIRAVGLAANDPSKAQNFAFGVLVAGAIGFNQAYGLDLDSKLKGTGIPDAFGNCLPGDGKCLVKKIKNTCLIENLINGFGGHTFSEYVVPGYDVLSTSNTLWSPRFEQNKLGNLPPTVPTYLWHGRDDQAVEYCQARQLAKTYCAAGVQTTWTKVDRNPLTPWLPAEHATAWTAGLVPSLNFLQARIDGNSAGNNCAALQQKDIHCPAQGGL